MDTQVRQPYPSDVSDHDWAFVVLALSAMRPDAPQRTYDRREVFNALRSIVRTGAPWRSLPGNFPPHERLPETVAGLHVVAFACLMPHRWVATVAQSP